MSVSMDTRVAAEIDQLLASATSGQAGLVHVVDKVLTKFQAEGWCFEQALPPRLVGVDPSNRDGFGLSPENVHALGDDIAFMGWSWNEVKNPTCIEEAPGASAIKTFNQELSDGSPLLPDVAEGSVLYGSLSCSHTNMFLRCVEASAPSQNPAFTVDGKLNLDLLDAKDREFAKAVRGGLTWTVLSHRVRSRFPEFLTLVQSARNVSQQVGRVEHEVQVMLRIHKLASAQQRNGLEPSWDAIKAAVLRSKPPCAPDLPQLIAFVASCAGGVDAPFLTDLVAFHRKCVNPDQRVVSGMFFKAVADNLASAPFVASAIVKAQYTCPKEKVTRHKECAWIASGDVVALAKKRERLAVVEAILRDVHVGVTEACAQESCSQVVTLEALAKLDTKAARFLIKKQDRQSAPASSIEEVVSTVLDGLVAKSPEVKPHLQALMERFAMTSPTPVANAPSGSSGPSLRLVEVKDGEVEAIVKLRANGFRRRRLCHREREAFGHVHDRQHVAGRCQIGGGIFWGLGHVVEGVANGSCG